MQLFSHSAVAVMQGSVLLFSAFQDDGPMWTDTGPRAERRQISFEKPYLAPPVVHISCGMWDIDGRQNQRADISAENVTTTGFEIVFRTWGDTRVARIRAEWLAIGAMRHEDDFDL